MRVGSFLRGTFLTGAVLFVAIALVITVFEQLLAFLLFPGRYLTDVVWVQAAIGVVVVFGIGVVVRLIGKTRHVWILKLLPTSLLEHPEVEWLTMPGVFARGVLLHERDNWCSVMEMTGGPLSLSYFPRRVDTFKVSRTGRVGKDLVIEMMTLGARNGNNKKT